MRFLSHVPLLPALVIVAVLIAGGLGHAAPTASSPPPVGGADFFFCALFQTLHVGGLLTGNLPAAAGGAIFGGFACGMGW